MNPTAVPFLNRRSLLLAGLAGAAAAPVAAAGGLDRIRTASMRGSLDAAQMGVAPGALDDQSRAFQKLLDAASERDIGIDLPPGVYVVSNLKLPKRVRLSGVPGATRLLYGGDGHLMIAEGAEQIELSGLVIDGANRWMSDETQGLLDARQVASLVVDNCRLLGSAKNAIALEAAGGRIERTEISGAGAAGIYAVQSSRLAVTGNIVSDCADGGILIHRWDAGEDGAIISGNRVERIAARSGGTGQNGNGINVFRAGNVIVSGNQISDCALSAIRANTASNVQIQGNTCLRSGETAIYSEFAFQGAVIAQNVIDGAANGISVANFNEGGRMAVCTGNLVRNLVTTGPYPSDPPGFGIGIAVEADCSVTGNVIEGAPLYGLMIGWGPFMRNVVATGNMLRDTGTGVAVSVVAGVGSALISDNVIAGAKGGAVVGYRWVEPATGDLAADGAETVRNVTVERNRVG